MKSFADFMKTLGPSRVAALALVAVGLFGFFAFVAIRVTEEPMAPLYSGLNQQDAAEIIAELDAQGVPYELQGDGTRIMVPEARMLRVRMGMAEKGLPSGKVVGYEIFDNADALGTTSFVQNLNHLRALEGEMARTIRSIDRVENARVHLVLPEREVFSRERQEPSASIALKLKGGQPLTREQVSAIQYLVSSGVNGLQPGRVSIVDEHGNLLASGDGNQNAAALNASYDERNIAYERRMREEIERIVESIVGPEKARVRVTAEMDFNRMTRTSERFDPEGQVVRSTQTVEESSSSSDVVSNDGVTVGNNIPDANFGAGETPASGTKDASSRLEETVNYEISSVTETEVLEAGRVERISVAVLVDGVYGTDENGNQTYKTRSQEDLNKIASLVRTAIGFDEERGDAVEVVNLRFAPRGEPEKMPEIEEPFMGLTKADYFRFAELAAIALISALVLLFVVRPFMKGLLTKEQPAVTGQALALNEEGEPIIGEDGQPMLAQEATDENGLSINVLPAPRKDHILKQSEVENMIDIARVEGKVRESSVKKVAELISGHPDETLSIIRNWLHEQPA